MNSAEYWQGWSDCLAGADGRYPAVYHPEYTKEQTQQWQSGWTDCYLEESE